MKKVNVKGPIVSNDTAWLYEYFGWECVSPAAVTKALEEAQGDDVIIEINSPGGVCVYGYEMYKAIRDYPGKTTAHVISAVSAATLVACAADETLMSDAAIFMIHNAQSYAEGDYRDMRMEGQALEEFNKGIINVYERKTGLGRDAIQGLMDNDTYMGPAKAIELGFADGYIYGTDGKDAGNDPGALVTQIAASGVQLIAEDKAMELIRLIRTGRAGTDGVTPQAQRDNGPTAVSDIQKSEGGTAMTLEEFLAGNPEAQSEIDAIRDEAKAQGVTQERERMKSLDAIAQTVSADALSDAKYGEHPLDGPTLAYRAMVDGDRLAKSYLASAQKDSGESGADDVGIGKPDAGEGQENESDEMAAYVNSRKGGRQ